MNTLFSSNDEENHYKPHGLIIIIILTESYNNHFLIANAPISLTSETSESASQMPPRRWNIYYFHLFI